MPRPSLKGHTVFSVFSVAHFEVIGSFSWRRGQVAPTKSYENYGGGLKYLFELIVLRKQNSMGRMV